MAELGTPCLHCSKPVRPGTGVLLEAGERAHVRCLAAVNQLKALEARTASKALHAESEALIARARAMARCVVCKKPLASGALFFQGERLVHASCWRLPTR